MLVRFGVCGLFATPHVKFSFATGVFEQLGTQRYGIVDGLLEVLSCFILAKKLLAHKKHSNAEAVTLYVLVMPLARADFLAVLDRIAA